jgi:predicted O-linked N-acetylglucosamine transferase (SPINDLY family)
MQSPQSRNAPCPCGSGKRYKECHGALSQAAHAEADDDLLARAQTAFSAGRHAEALAALRRALAAKPESAELLRECARIAWMMGDAARARADCRAALDRAPSDATAWNLLGEILRSTDTAAAEGAWRQALEIDAANPEARFGLGNLFRDRGDPWAARREYERALGSAPEHPRLLNNLGLALEASGERARAEACYERVLAANPRHPDALGNLASSLFEREAYRQSAATYERLFAIRRDVPAPVWVRRGQAQQRMGDLASAEASFMEAARLEPDDAPIQHNLGSVRVELQRYADAEPAWLRVLELRPENPYALSMLAYTRQNRCDWRGLSELHTRINRVLEADAVDWRDTVSPFNILAMPTSALAQLRAAERWARAFAPPSPGDRPAIAAQRSERLRVGFVSSDFRLHPMVHLSIAFWEGFDRDRFETYAYGIYPADPGPIGQRVARAFDHFADVSEAPVPAIAGQIRADRIEVLIDLNGYTQNSREQIFSLRPAPVQVSYLGYPGTLGADWYDYVIVDQFNGPDALQPFFTERLLQLPHSSVPGNPDRLPAGPPPTRAECGLPDDAFVFACFNSAFKILPDVFGVWMRLLHAIERSVLWLLEAPGDAEDNLRREARLAGIDPARLVFASRVAVERHVARIAAADLVVDSFPYGAHTTANDALLAGVPLVTHAGETLVTRIAGSQLHAIGLSELVTSDRSTYEALARGLAESPGELSRYRARLTANRTTFPLFDTARFTRDFEAAVIRARDEIAAR